MDADDMQYAQQGHSPDNTTIQDNELRHQIRRLAHHPAIVMWDGCTSCAAHMHSQKSK
jgi:beta-mannosidase